MAEKQSVTGATGHAQVQKLKVVGEDKRTQYKAGRDIVLQNDERKNAEIKASKLEKGDVIQINYGLFYDYCVYVGDGNVVRKIKEGRVQEEPLVEAVSGQPFYKDNNLDCKYKPLPPDVIVRAARSKIGKSSFHLTKDNSEHFANWCRYGEEVSQQYSRAQPIVEDIVSGLGALFTKPN